jgi:hypothetical protein
MSTKTPNKIKKGIIKLCKALEAISDRLAHPVRYDDIIAKITGVTIEKPTTEQTGKQKKKIQQKEDALKKQSEEINKMSQEDILLKREKRHKKEVEDVATLKKQKLIIEKEWQQAMENIDELQKKNLQDKKAKEDQELSKKQKLIIEKEYRDKKPYYEDKKNIQYPKYEKTIQKPQLNSKIEDFENKKYTKQIQKKKPENLIYRYTPRIQITPSIRDQENLKDKNNFTSKIIVEQESTWDKLNIVLKTIAIILLPIAIPILWALNAFENKKRFYKEKLINNTSEDSLCYITGLTKTNQGHKTHRPNNRIIIKKRNLMSLHNGSSIGK